MCKCKVSQLSTTPHGLDVWLGLLSSNGKFLRLDSYHCHKGQIDRIVSLNSFPISTTFIPENFNTDRWYSFEYIFIVQLNKYLYLHWSDTFFKRFNSRNSLNFREYALLFVKMNTESAKLSILGRIKVAGPATTAADTEYVQKPVNR